MIRTHKIKMALSLTVLLTSHSSFATSCYEMSPNYRALGDKYYDLNNSVTLTAHDKKTLNATLKKLVGHWKGKGSIFQCIGSELNPIVKNEALILTAKITTNVSNELHIDIEKYHVDDKFKSNDHLFYFGNVGNYRSVLITPNKIGVEERFRQSTIKVKPNADIKGQKNFKQFHEILSSIEHDKNHVNYISRRYINGRLATEERWTLVRD